MEFKAQSIADFLGGKVEGDPNATVHDVAKIEEGRPGTLAFLSNPKYNKNLFNKSQVAMFQSKLDGSEALDFNDKYCELTGYSHDEIIGKPAALRWAYPEKRDEMVSALKEKGVITDFEAEVLTKNGDILTVLASNVLYPEENINIGSMVDITKRKKMEIASYSKLLGSSLTSSA